ncbi:MAG: outer membrane beta-barrel protein [Verrucomicrobiota bacterium]|nr:outer membrane beta-barrel protein [Verrucomicrobiota bacterium]
MKNKILALMATVGLVASAYAFEINENISINGFIDGSYSDMDTAAGDKGFGLDEVEVNFLLNVGSVSGAIHVDTDDNQAGTDELFNIEQAHVTYSLENGVSFTFGQYGSALGFEREDPAGLYTYSRAYNDAYNLGNVDLGTVHGLTIAYSGDAYAIALSIEEDGSFGATDDDLDLELAITYTGIENASITVGYFFDNDAQGGERDIFNLHGSYQVGKAMLAAEFITADDDAAGAGEDAYMLLVDYDFTDKLGGALRYSEYEISSTQEGEKFTIAPNYAITDSLGAIVEYSVGEENNADADTFAVELTYTF